MARRDYGFVRSYASIGRDPTQLRNLMSNGYAGALFAYDDPYLAQAIAMARQEGVPFGIWADPHGRGAQQYAMMMANLYNQYRPEIMVPDIEFIGKGYQGSQGWQYNEDLARYWNQYLPGVRTAVTVMPNQKDFNYGAWTRGVPGVEWMPQAYGANPVTDVFDPQQIVQTLIDQGVDPSMISPVLGPGHTSGYGGSALWTIDDFYPYGGRPFPKAQGPENRSQATGGRDARTSGTSRNTGPLRPGILGRGASQSRAMVESQGLHWGGQTFRNQASFEKYLQSRGRSYNTWAQQHQPAAQALAARSPNARPRS